MFWMEVEFFQKNPCSKETKCSFTFLKERGKGTLLLLMSIHDPGQSYVSVLLGSFISWYHTETASCRDLVGGVGGGAEG